MDKKQIIGLLILLVVLGGIMLTVNLVARHYPQSTIHNPQSTIHNPPNWDSIRAARRDSAKAYWDSVRVARRDSAKAYWDSVRVARRDSAKAYWDSVKEAQPLHPYSSTPLPLKKDTVLDLNRADTTELKYLRGVGSYVAKRIVRYREELGGYVSKEQLREIDVLCRYDRDTSYAFKFDSVLPHLQVDTNGVHRMPINKMSAGMLSKHPYLRFDEAKALYELRRRKFNLKSIDDIRPVLGDSLAAKLEPYLDFTLTTKH